MDPPSHQTCHTCGHGHDRRVVAVACKGRKACGFFQMAHTALDFEGVAAAAGLGTAQLAACSQRRCPWEGAVNPLLRARVQVGTKEVGVGLHCATWFRLGSACTR